MAKSLKTLLRVHEWNVEQKRRQLGKVVSSISILDTKLKQLQNELTEEQLFAKESPIEAGSFYPNYGKSVILLRNRIGEERASLEIEADVIREDLNIAYNELKKFEVISAERAKQEKQELERNEQIILDDLSIESVYRKKK